MIRDSLADFTTVRGASGSFGSYFIARRKDGSIYEYGNSDSSVISASGSSAPYQWRLNKVRNRDDVNYIVTYGTGLSGSAGIGVPLSISYASTGAGSPPYRYRIDFSYTADTTDGTEIGYMAGGSMVNNNWLNRIEVKRLDVVKSLRTYSFGYDVSPTTNRRRLTSVQECSDPALTSCLTPTTVSYQNGEAGVSAISNAAISATTSVKGVYDFNGDGRQDVLYVSGTSLQVAFATATGYGTPVSTGVTLATTDYYDAADLIASGKDDILVTRSGVWYRYSWNGSAFTGASTGTAAGSDEKVDGSALADISGDGLPDLLTISSTGGSTQIFSRLNTSTGSGLTFSATRTLAWTGATAVSNIRTSTARSYREMIDFNGDGRNDVVVSMFGASLGLVSQGNIFSGSALNANGRVVNWNDDKCTDVITLVSTINISTCNGFASQQILYTGTFLAAMDWNGDGRADLLVNSGGNIRVRLSTGGGIGPEIPTTIPAPNNPIVFDQNGDGLDDIASTGAASPFAVTYRLHNGAGTPPDLATSITDGYGIAFNQTYGSIVQGSYTKSSGATLPEKDIQIPLYVVRQVQASDGASGSYTKTYSYAGARENVQGRGFSGFQSVTVTDSRNNSPVVKTHYLTAFPFAGWPYQRDVYQNNGTTLITNTLNAFAITVLSSTAYQQRYFPYTYASTNHDYEVGGSKNGLLTKVTGVINAYDNYGNLTSSSTVVTDKDNAAPQSPTFDQSWATTVTNTFSPDTANWCLGIPTQTSVTQFATNVPAITRTTSFTPDYVKCRISQRVVEPTSASYKVTTAFGYDSWGNPSSETVTGINMAARTTQVYWGETGTFPATLTNALSHVTNIFYNYDFGVRSSAIDPNNLTTTWTYDAFGRITNELRPDGLSTGYSYNKCADVAGGCQNGDPASGATGINRMVVITVAKNASGTAMRDDWLYLDQFERPIVTKSKTLTGGYSRIGAQYDAYGRLYRQTEPCDAASCSVYWTTNAYDIRNRLMSQTRRISVSNSGTQSTAVSYQGLTTVVTDPQGKTTTKVVDPNGWLRQSKDHDGYYQSFGYDAFGSLATVADSQSNSLFSATYDYGLSAFRRQTVDMDLGTWSYTPNALGEVTGYTDARGSVFSLAYDKLSRPLTRTVSGDGTTTWTWGSSAASYNIGKLQYLTSTGGTTESYFYDNKGRLDQRQVVADGDSYVYDLDYNATTGLQDALTYPTSTGGYRLKLRYSYVNGLLNQISDFNDSGNFIWRASAMNPRFQVTQESLGNGIVTNNGFDAVTGWLSTRQSGVGSGSGVQNEAYEYDKLGNVTRRQNPTASLSETFFYDNLYRLDYSQLNNNTNLNLSYNAVGNITQRCEPTCGSTWTYDATKKHAVTQASVGSTSYNYAYDNNGNVTSRNGNSITWNKYNYPTQINGSGESVSLNYDASFQRWKQTYTQSGATETTLYIGGLLEMVTTDASVDWRHSIVANGKVVALVSRTDTGVNTTRYVLDDQQGSIAKITNNSGGTTVGESFTAFGARRNPGTWSGAPSAGDLTTISGISRQGYTGHTALGNMGLNHMNGRVQDALTGRFLSADPYITEPGNSQSYNRYSYVNNNPLSLVDPSGFIIETVFVTAPASGPAAPIVAGAVLGYSLLNGNFFGGLFGGGSSPPPPEAEPVADGFGTSSGNYAYYDPGLDPTGGCVGCPVGEGVNSFVITSTRDSASLLRFLAAGTSGLTGAQANTVFTEKGYEVAQRGAGARGGMLRRPAIEDLAVRNGEVDPVTGRRLLEPLQLGTPVVPYYPPNSGFARTPEPLTLQPGARINRVGLPSGSFASPAGTPYGARALPYGYESLPSTTYEVLRPFPVLSGPAAPAFQQFGGGTQYRTFGSFQYLLENGYIRAVPP